MPKLGPKTWLAVALVPWLVSIALVRLGVVGVEGLGYLVPVCVLAALPAAFLHWRGIDEPSREAHKFATFWGMGFGVAITVLIAAEITLFPGAQDVIAGWVDAFIARNEGGSGDQPGAVGFYLGILACGAVAIVGYFVMWLGWWAFQRIGTKSD